jgi:hypothetical protein
MPSTNGSVKREAASVIRHPSFVIRSVLLPEHLNAERLNA